MKSVRIAEFSPKKTFAGPNSTAVYNWTGTGNVKHVSDCSATNESTTDEQRKVEMHSRSLKSLRLLWEALQSVQGATSWDPRFVLGAPDPRKEKQLTHRNTNQIMPNCVWHVPPPTSSSDRSRPHVHKDISSEKRLKNDVWCGVLNVLKTAP